MRFAIQGAHGFRQIERHRIRSPITGRIEQVLAHETIVPEWGFQRLGTISLGQLGKAPLYEMCIRDSLASSTTGLDSSLALVCMANFCPKVGKGSTHTAALGRRLPAKS